MSVRSRVESIRRAPVVDLFVRAYRRGASDYAKDMAASVAYFTFFSLFPLLLGAVAVGSLYLDSAAIQARVDRFLVETLPGSEDLVRGNLEALIRLRGAIGVVSVVGLFWSASKMFGAISRGINRALDLERPHPSYLSRLRHFGLTLGVSLLLFLAMTVSTGLDLLANLELPIPDGRLSRLLEVAEGQVVSYLFVVVIFAALYGLVPFVRPSLREILPASLFAALLFEIGRAGFVWYLESSANFEAVYGSLTSIIVLLLWLYFYGRVLLFGAELIAARRTQKADDVETG